MKIALIGYGKMGKTIERIAKERGHEIVSIIDLDNQHDFESVAFASADVAIEFTVPAVALSNYRRTWDAGVKLVSGTTGWTSEMAAIKKEIQERGSTLFWTSNFSIGVNIFFELNRHLARIMNQFPNYDVSLKEIHHIHKLDAPSGTAISLAEDLLCAIDRKTKWVKGAAEEAPEIGIEDIREGEVPGYHAVKYDSNVDTIEIIHNAKSREGFALGAVVAAEFTAKNSGFLSMADMMKF